MRYTFKLVFLSLLSAVQPVRSQPVSDLPFDHLYDPLAEVVLHMQPFVMEDSLAVYYRIKTNLADVGTYLVQWEKRESFGQRQGSEIATTDTITLSKGWHYGKFRFPPPQKPWLLVARVTNLSTGKYWHFIRQVESHYPVNGYLEKDGVRLFETFISAEYKYNIHGSGSDKPIFVSFYRDNFPTPSPPFVVKEVKADRFLFPDSVFIAAAGSTVGPFSRDGLYLAQEDTISQKGFSFYVRHEPYPRYNKLEDLKGPLLFVTTQEENESLSIAGEDKAKFDRIILKITNDKDRARNFIRNYFRRVEWANFYFTSFKEGWKTDRGMIYIVFGRPDEVRIDGGMEEWFYKNPRQGFRFAKAGSVYHPDHSVLIREKGYTEYWYMTIDLWRKSRF